jgi:hypothetical protein
MMIMTIMIVVSRNNELSNYLIWDPPEYTIPHCWFTTVLRILYIIIVIIITIITIITIIIIITTIITIIIIIIYIYVYL